MKQSWKKEGWLWCALMVAACQTVEGPGASLPPSRAVNQADGFPLTLSVTTGAMTASVPSGGNFALQQAADWGATASNSLGALVPARVVDGNLGTQWANGEFRAASAWLAIDTGAVRPMAAVRVKLAPFAGGASYRIEVSDDGVTWRSVTGPLRNAGWQLEIKPFFAPTEARHVRLVFTNDPVLPEGRFSLFEVGTDFQAGGVSPSPSPTPVVSPTPAATGTISPTPSASLTPSPAPTPSPTPAPLTAPSGVPVVNVPAPGPLAARGRILLNGVPPWTPVSVTIVRSSDWNQRTVTTDAAGYFQATGLAPGSYFAYYYNETQRDRIGYWRSRTLPVDATRGAGFPQVDFGQRGLVNQPPMGARLTLPGNFEWVPPAQAVASYRFRVHSEGGRTFRLIYQSGALPGNATTFSWNGAGTTEPLNRFNRYFWGLVWDAGPVGEGGNLYQPVSFNQP